MGCSCIKQVALIMSIVLDTSRVKESIRGTSKKVACSLLIASMHIKSVASGALSHMVNYQAQIANAVLYSYRPTCRYLSMFRMMSAHKVRSHSIHHQSTQIAALNPLPESRDMIVIRLHELLVSAHFIVRTFSWSPSDWKVIDAGDLRDSFLLFSLLESHSALFTPGISTPSFSAEASMSCTSPLCLATEHAQTETW